ncbi:chromatin remodelling complex Rsc7/Swp82 subunit-domain-containing protein [Phycomyces nitens]|nr:chromatin remodelling complex Rsc7/Swp82 subunit-domain-containing protein [Phycomyces nitens]
MKHSSQNAKKKGRSSRKKNLAGGRDADLRQDRIDKLDDVDHDSTDEESDHSFDDDLSDNDTHSPSQLGKKRGRPKSGSRDERPKKVMSGVYEVEDDIDEIGETKVDSNGHLLGGRQYKVTTFTLPERDNMLFMFSKDPAALLNFRDSFVFLKKNPKLVKVHVTDAEKNHLVERDLLRSTFRTREVSVVTARSVFKQFGHRVVKKGRKGRDDYYYTGEVEDNDMFGDDKDSEDDGKEVPADKSWAPFALTGRNNITNKGIARLAGPVTEVNWMHHVAVSIRDFNAHLCEYRRENPAFYDIHTNVYQIPLAKQPRKRLYQPDPKKTKTSKPNEKPLSGIAPVSDPAMNKTQVHPIGGRPTIAGGVPPAYPATAPYPFMPPM